MAKIISLYSLMGSGLVEKNLDLETRVFEKTPLPFLNFGEKKMPLYSNVLKIDVKVHNVIKFSEELFPFGIYLL